MTEYRPYTKTGKRQIIDWNYLVDLPDEKIMVCLNPQFIQICLFLANSRGLWRSTYAIEYLQNGYIIPTPSQFTYIENLIAEGITDMSGCGEIVTELANIVTALQNQACCGSSPGGGSAGSGITPAQPSTQQTGATEREGDPPPGFETWGEYDTYACDMAWYIVNQIRSDIATSGIVAAGIASATTLAPLLVTALFTPIAFDDLLVVAFLVIQTFVIALSVAEIEGAIDDNANSIVCALLDGTDVDSSISSAAVAIDEAIASDTEISALGEYAVGIVQQLVKAFLTVDSVNRLYVKVPYEIPSGNDCGDCSPPTDDLYLFNPDFETQPGTLISGSFADEAVIESVYLEVAGGFRDAILLASVDYPLNNRIAVIETIDDTTGDVILDYWQGTTGGFGATYPNLASIEALGETICTYYAIFRGTTGASDPFTIRLQFLPGEA